MAGRILAARAKILPTHAHTGNCSDESAQKRAIFPDHGRPRKQKPPRERPCFPEQPPPDFRGCVCPLSVWFARRYGVKTSVSFRPLVLQRVRTRARKRLHNEKKRTHTRTRWFHCSGLETTSKNPSSSRIQHYVVRCCVSRIALRDNSSRGPAAFPFSRGELCE